MLVPENDASAAAFPVMTTMKTAEQERNNGATITVGTPAVTTLAPVRVSPSSNTVTRAVSTVALIFRKVEPSLGAHLSFTVYFQSSSLKMARNLVSQRTTR